MSKPKILALVGGISQNSINKKLFFAFTELAGDEAEFIIADISRLPFFSQDIENDPPDSVVAFKDQIREADAVLFVTPEYNRSMPGVLKNAIDWGSRPYGQNLWEKIPAAIMGASAGTIGTYAAQNHLRASLVYLKMLVMNAPEFYLHFSRAFTPEGKFVDDKSRNFVQKFWDSFKEWIESHGLQDEERHAFKSQGLEDSPGIHH